MTKKNALKNIPKRSYRKPILLALLLTTAGGIFWKWSALQDWQEQTLAYIENRDIVTLETRVTPEQVLGAEQEKLLVDNQRSLRNSATKYYPYLQLDVKYCDAQKTHEGILLWGLHDGEMVIDMATWEVSRGFRYCLECQATQNDFKILQSLARHGQSMTLDELQKELHIERETLAPMLESAKKKHLIIMRGHLVQMHFDNPKMLVIPKTQINQQFVSKPVGDAQIASKNYSYRQIIALAQTAFGNEFKIIGKGREVFLPVYAFEIANKDGSIQIIERNALTGKSLY